MASTTVGILRTSKTTASRRGSIARRSEAASTGDRFVEADDAKDAKLGAFPLASSATTDLLDASVNIRILHFMLGLHLIFSTYGFWPPNDPRGSGSTRVRAAHIYEAGGGAAQGPTPHFR